MNPIHYWLMKQVCNLCARMSGGWGCLFYFFIISLCAILVRANGGGALRVLCGGANELAHLSNQLELAFGDFLHR
jgi:hypothetical protein